MIKLRICSVKNHRMTGLLWRLGLVNNVVKQNKGDMDHLRFDGGHLGFRGPVLRLEGIGLREMSHLVLIYI